MQAINLVKPAIATLHRLRLFNMLMLFHDGQCHEIWKQTYKLDEATQDIDSKESTLHALQWQQLARPANRVNAKRGSSAHTDDRLQVHRCQPNLQFHLGHSLTSNASIYCRWFLRCNNVVVGHGVQKSKHEHQQNSFSSLNMSYHRVSYITVNSSR